MVSLEGEVREVWRAGKPNRRVLPLDKRVIKHVVDWSGWRESASLTEPSLVPAGGYSIRPVARPQNATKGLPIGSRGHISGDTLDRE